MDVGCQVIVALVTIYLLQSTNACRCMSGHPQQEICTRNFAMKAKILANNVVIDNIPYTRRLTVKVKDNFKGVSGNIETLYTYDHGSLCGANLTVKKTYLITGVIRDNRRVISTCYLIQEWKDVDPCVQIKLKRGIYLRNCNCKVRQCRPEHCGTAAPNECTLNIFEHRPELSNGLCRKRRGVCTWEECPGLRYG